MHRQNLAISTPSPALGDKNPAPLQVSDLVERCGAKGLRVYDGDLVTEAGAAALLGYAGPDALRRQVYEGRSHPPFRMRGNRRFYALADIVPWMPG